MKRQSFTAMNLVSAGYENGVLEAEMKSGEILQYEGVPESIWEGLKTAIYPGPYYANVIKECFKSKKIS